MNHVNKKYLIKMIKSEVIPTIAEDSRSGIKIQ